MSCSKFAVISLCGLFFLSTPLKIEAAELKPLSQQLRESPVGKWLNVWGNYGFIAGASSIETGTNYSESFVLGLRGTPAKVLTLDVSMVYLNVGKFENTSSYESIGGYEYDFLGLHRAYATLNVVDNQLRIVGGRRPFGESVPLNTLQNKGEVDDRGNPSLLENIYFDGGALSYAPKQISSLGSYFKVFHGLSYDFNERTAVGNSFKDNEVVGVTIAPLNTNSIQLWFQWQRAFDLFDSPAMNNTAFGNTSPSTNLGDIDWFGLGVKLHKKKAGIGDLNFFLEGGMNVTRPNGNVSSSAGFTGLLSGQLFSPEAVQEEKTGYAVYTGIRYDFPTKTKVGFEYNYGSKNWIASSMLDKAGTRGNVYEPFIIQEIPIPIFSKTFFRVGYQYFDFEYTGSNNWIGAPIKISAITSGTLLLQAPISHADNIYGAFEIHF